MLHSIRAASSVCVRLANSSASCVSTNRNGLQALDDLVERLAIRALDPFDRGMSLWVAHPGRVAEGQHGDGPLAVLEVEQLRHRIGVGHTVGACADAVVP